MFELKTVNDDIVIKSHDVASTDEVIIKILVLQNIQHFLVLVQACATRGGVRSEAGHCFHLLFSSSSFLRLLLFTHFGETSVTENLFPPIFWHKLVKIWDFFSLEGASGHGCPTKSLRAPHSASPHA